MQQTSSVYAHGPPANATPDGHTLVKPEGEYSHAPPASAHAGSVSAVDWQLVVHRPCRQHATEREGHEQRSKTLALLRGVLAMSALYCELADTLMDEFGQKGVQAPQTSPENTVVQSLSTVHDWS